MSGFNAGLGFPISENGRARVFYSLSEDTIDDVTTDSSEILQREEGSLITSAIGYRLSYDTRTSGLDPTSGIRLEFGQELAGLGGDNQYIETTALAQGVANVLREEVTLRATIEGGALSFIDGGSRLTDRFFLSSRQMRGFEPFGLGPRDLASVNQDALGGNYFAVARFEAAFPIGLPDEYGITGGLFFDVGTVWGLDDIVGTGGTPVDDDLALRATVGFSVFWDTALGRSALQLLATGAGRARRSDAELRPDGRDHVLIGMRRLLAAVLVAVLPAVAAAQGPTGRFVDPRPGTVLQRLALWATRAGRDRRRRAGAGGRKPQHRGRADR